MSASRRKGQFRNFAKKFFREGGRPSGCCVPVPLETIPWPNAASCTRDAVRGGPCRRCQRTYYGRPPRTRFGRRIPFSHPLFAICTATASLGDRKRVDENEGDRRDLSRQAMGDACPSFRSRELDRAPTCKRGGHEWIAAGAIVPLGHCRQIRGMLERFPPAR